MDNRKPCPFCGETRIAISRFLNYGRKMYKLHCPKCNAHSGISETEENAIRHWNNRLLEDRLLAAINQAYVALREISRLRNLNPNLKYQGNAPCAENVFCDLYCRMGDIANIALSNLPTPSDKSETSAPSAPKELHK